MLFRSDTDTSLKLQVIAKSRLRGILQRRGSGWRAVGKPKLSTIESNCGKDNLILVLHVPLVLQDLSVLQPSPVQIIILPAGKSHLLLASTCYELPLSYLYFRNEGVRRESRGGV